MERHEIERCAAFGLGVALVLLFWRLIRHVCRLYFTPLSQIPGPKLWAVSHIPYIYHLRRGTLTHRIAALHAVYGSAVRVSPDEVSFTTAESLKEIYAYRGKVGAFPKSHLWHPRGPDRTNSLSSANTADHARIRKVLASAFDGTANKAQESIIGETTKQFAEQLLRQAGEGHGKATINMTEWLNFCTFDVIGRLGFSDSDIFACLQQCCFPPSLVALFKGARMLGLRIAFQQVSFYKFFWLLRHPSMLTMKPTPNQHVVHIGECIDRRLSKTNTETDKRSHQDIFSVLQSGMENEFITVTEMRKTAMVLFGGGGGTTAAALSGTINYLLRYPRVLHKLTTEVRAAFKGNVQICDVSLEGMEYMNAVIREGLRLCPSIPCGVPRAVPVEGAVVSGYSLPGGTIVSVPQYALHRSPDYWAEPDTFVPERWLRLSSSSPYVRDVRSVMQPFSLGPRRCPGVKIAYTEMRQVLALLTLHFDLSTARNPDGSEMPHWEKQKTWPIWDKHPYYVNLSIVKL